MRPLGPPQRDRSWAWAWAIILAATAVRLWFAASGQLNLVQDEAQYWDWTRRLQLTYYSKGPLIAWYISLWTKVLGNTELGVRFGSIVMSLLTQAALFIGLAGLMNRPRAGLWALAVYNTMPIIGAYSVLMSTDSLFLFFWTGAVFCLYAAGRSRGPGRAVSPAALAGLGLFLAGGVLSKYTMLGFPALAACYVLRLKIGRSAPRGLVIGTLAALAAGLFIGFLPTLIWNIQNEFVGYRHVLHLVGVSGATSEAFFKPNRFLEFLALQTAVISPWWLLFMFYGGAKALSAALGRRPRAWGADKDQSLLLALFFWPVWGLFLVWSLHAKILSNWTIVSLVTGAAMAGLALEGLASRKKRLPALGWASLILGLAVFLVLHFGQGLPLPAQYNPAQRLKGWQDLGAEVGRLAGSRFEDPARVFYFSDLYDLTAALAFYVPGQPRTFCVWAEDRRMNQYDLWPGPEDRLGWDAVFVRKRFADGVPEEVKKMFRRIDPAIKFQTTFNGNPARKFTIFCCHGYTGYWPRQEGGGF